LASVGSLTVEIAADIAKLRTGVDETQRRLGDLERTTAKTGASMQASFEKSIAGIQAAWLKIGAIAITAKKAWDFAEQATKFEQQKVSLDNLAASYGSNGNKIIAALRHVSDGTIDTMTLVNKAGSAMMLGINPEKITKLMEIARATSRMTGQSITKAFEDIALGVGRQSKMILDNLGIIVQVDDANQKYAATLGKTAAGLNDAEKKAAFLSATIEAGENLMRRMGEQTNTTADKMERFKTTLSNVKIALGGFIIDVGFKAVAAFQWLAAGALIAAANIAKLTIPLGRLSDFTGASKGQADYNRSIVKNLEGAAAALTGAAANNWATVESKAVAAGVAIERVHNVSVAATKAIKDGGQEQEQLWKDAVEQANLLRRVKEISNSDAEKIARMELERELRKTEAYKDQLEKLKQIGDQIKANAIDITKSEVAKGFSGTNIGSPLGGLMDSMSGTDIYSKQMDNIKSQYQMQVDAYEQYTGDMISIGNAYYTKQEAMAAAAANRDKQINALKWRQGVSMTSDAFGTMAALAQAFYAASDNQSRLALQAYKAFAIAQVMVDTAQSAMALFAFGSRFGPWTAAAFAGIAVAAGAARVAQIANIQPGTSSVSAGGAASGVPVGASPTTQDTSVPSTSMATAQRAGPTIQIYVQGHIIDQDKFARELIPSIRKAMEDNL